ncbi:hypothetical protein [Nonomuraea bangladeshensis]|uniref:hypothetical protein n=1 Tax=Nonomuraea bangladeshensis TaxID=404385 RepID=UPI003C2BCDCF
MIATVGRVLDTSALTDFATQRTRYMEAVVWMHDAYVGSLVIPAPALTAAYAAVPDRARPVLDVLVGLETVVVVPIDEGNAAAIADTLRVAGITAPEAITAASVVHAALRRRVPIVTGQPFPLRAISADVELDPIP